MSTKESSEPEVERSAEEEPSSEKVIVEAPEGEARLPRFANFANMSHSPHGFVLTFGFLETMESEEPEESRSRAKIVARVALSPSLVLALLQLLAKNYYSFQSSFPNFVPRGAELKKGEGVGDEDARDDEEPGE